MTDLEIEERNLLRAEIEHLKDYSAWYKRDMEQAVKKLIKENDVLQAQCHHLKAQVEKLFSDYWKLKLERKEDLGKD
jgi:hypothetical protein